MLLRDSVREIREAIAEVERYLEAKSFDYQAHPEFIHTYFNGKLGTEPCQLRTQDIRVLLEVAYMYLDLCD